MFITFRRISR